MQHTVFRTPVLTVLAILVAALLVGGSIALSLSGAGAQTSDPVTVTEDDLVDIARCMNPLCTGDECDGIEYTWTNFDISKDAFACHQDVAAAKEILDCDPRTRLPDPNPDGTCTINIGDNVVETTNFGFAMEAALKQFQTLYALPVTGILDSATKNILSQLTSDFSVAYDMLLGTLGGGGISGVGIPFGGMVQWIVPCTCNLPPATLVFVGPPRGGPFLYIPGVTTVFEYFQIPRVGVWLLGLYVPGATCMIWEGKICVPYPIQPIGRIMMTGTSL